MLSCFTPAGGGLRDAKVAGGAGQRSGSAAEPLLDAIDRTKTPLGARFLHAQLLSPLADVASLHARRDCVDKLLNDEGVSVGQAA